jgi:hypothetical protein
MNTNRFAKFVAVAFGLAAFSTVGSAETTQTAGASAPLARDLATTTVPGPNATVPAAAAAGPDVAFARWIDIKECTYDMRAQFFAGLSRLESRVDGQVKELTARRAAMNSTANTQDWDFAMKEMENARVLLRSTGEDLSKASPETWGQQKDKVGEAWVRTQEAYARVKSSTTS